MKKYFFFAAIIAIIIVSCKTSKPAAYTDNSIPVRGFCIVAPLPRTVDSFIHFINHDLAPRGVNVLVLRVDFNYQYTSHPELQDSIALSKEDVKKIVAACKKNQIKVIPQVNLLGHQSWANKTYNLLKKYPQFDETPAVIMPAKYQWPNDDGLYCRSYCPLHPEVHAIVFSLIDEICDVFETDAFHAGMDEVFYIGDARCPRCGGRDKAELFEGEVWTLHDHLQQKGRDMWIWGDRLLDGKTTGLGEWEASMNNTYRAIDLIPKDVVICDWHYERADKTAVYFAMKGFRVVTCPWRQPSTALIQIKDMLSFRKESTPEMSARCLGVMETTWMRTSFFLNSYYTNQQIAAADENVPWNCFRVMYDAINKLQ